MSDIHNHYHLFPEDRDGDWACCGMMFSLCAAIIVVWITWIIYG